METKKGESQVELVKIKDATKLIDKRVNLLGVVIERREPKQCRTKDWICTLRILDSYPSPGLTVNVFSKNPEELPKPDGMMILFINVQMTSFNGGRGVNATCHKKFSSFAVYNRRTGEEGFVCYQRSSNFRGEERYKSTIEELGKLFATSGILDQAQTPEFSFLREIKERKLFNLVCKILHVNEDRSTIFVWDGTDAPPAPIGSEDKSVSNLSAHTLLSRDTLCRFPTVGTILRVSLSKHLFHAVKPGDWVKLHQLRCVVDKGSWIGYGTDSKIATLAQDDHLVEKIKRIYAKRIKSKFGHIPFWSFPSPPGLTETDDEQAQFVTLMDIITYPEVTFNYKCIVRVVSAFRYQGEGENLRYRVLLTLEDPTATLEAFLCDHHAEHFFGLGLKNTEMLRKKWDQLLGITRERSITSATRKPPWIECCISSYYTDEADRWNTRFYKIFGTRLL